MLLWISYIWSNKIIVYLWKRYRQLWFQYFKQPVQGGPQNHIPQREQHWSWSHLRQTARFRPVFPEWCCIGVGTCALLGMLLLVTDGAENGWSGRDAAGDPGAQPDTNLGLVNTVLELTTSQQVFMLPDVPCSWLPLLSHLIHTVEKDWVQVKRKRRAHSSGIPKRLTDDYCEMRTGLRSPWGCRNTWWLAVEGCGAITFPGAHGKGGEGGAIGPWVGNRDSEKGSPGRT